MSLSETEHLHMPVLSMCFKTWSATTNGSHGVRPTTIKFNYVLDTCVKMMQHQRGLSLEQETETATTRASYASV